MKLGFFNNTGRWY